MSIGEDLDRPTAARVLGISTAAFAKRVSRARKRLSELLDTQSSIPPAAWFPTAHPAPAHLKEA